ncbi:MULTISPECIES: GDP-mannose 4,6-dehydratase [Gordonibacter]|uniref:GDP-mannose 4,6-dehydratase n=1 Tax=Gordonibacter TaxID=644652 RepID=UPI001D094889|nr:MULTISPECIES: GDP-mannose 4,6-dehydratase [Gordonibacter]MCB6312901.1 GDP-mannose 4,6-dehydratase [Gordonibacter pamelaeae]MCB6561730.1 GDP-mannose 4,6-dehydratase [Gordonibacter urolithinfaciens]MCB7085721.1 GDP-mannose 4,6-dehydratase [Gordonibacter urolithinfaciens]
MKKALITGITGQDGSYLAELLLDKGYEVHGVMRRSSVRTTSRIDGLLKEGRVTLHNGDLTDSSSLIRVIGEVRPDEIYNLAAQSHVGVSFDAAEYTSEVDAVGVLRILEAVRILGLAACCRIYQASTSELYGKVVTAPQNEETPFHPYSPYAVAKQYGFWIVKEYREAYGMFAVNGILFNHESERRGSEFVTRKITLAASRIANGLQDHLELGNLDSLRDWGYAKDYVECMWLMMQQAEPDDYVVATGVQHSVRDFTNWAFEEAGISLKWEGMGAEEKGFDACTGKMLVCVSDAFYRPTDVVNLWGDPTKARTRLGWDPDKTSCRELCKIMMAHDMELARNEKNAGA